MKNFDVSAFCFNGTEVTIKAGHDNSHIKKCKLTTNFGEYRKCIRKYQNTLYEDIKKICKKKYNN
jgi:hypothetical protein